MKKVIVKEFGQPEVLKILHLETPDPGPGQVRVALTSVGMNQADLMARRGEYILSSGFPPFTPGIEGGGFIEAIGKGVTNRKVGQRVILGADAPRRNNKPEVEKAHGGTYSSHYFVPAEQTVPAPDNIPDEQLGTLWLPYLTAWGCLIWKQKIKPGQYVAIPAASSSVGLAAAQLVKAEGARPIGLTTSGKKAAKIKDLPESCYDDIIVTHNPDRTMRNWHRDIKRLTQGKGPQVFFDPVAAGAYLDLEIRSLANHGTIWIYGLLGQTDKVDVSPLIRKRAALRGWYLNELTEEGGPALQEGYKYILDKFEKGLFKQTVAKTFSLDQVVQAHQEFQKGTHIGKFILVPN